MCEEEASVSTWTPEQAREMGRRGGRASGKARRTAEAIARAKLARESPKLAEELLKAARGEPPYDKLDPKDRLNAVLRALEHGIGRAPQAKVEEPKEGFAPGLVLQLGEEPR